MVVALVMSASLLASVSLMVSAQKVCGKSNLRSPNDLERRVLQYGGKKDKEEDGKEKNDKDDFVILTTFSPTLSPSKNSPTMHSTNYPTNVIIPPINPRTQTPTTTATTAPVTLPPPSNPPSQTLILTPPQTTPENSPTMHSTNHPTNVIMTPMNPRTETPTTTATTAPVTLPPPSNPPAQTLNLTPPQSTPETGTVLPEIAIDMTATSIMKGIIVENTCVDFLEQFAMGLLSSSRSIPESALDATTLEVSFVFPTTHDDGISSSTITSAVPMRRSSSYSSFSSFVTLDPLHLKIRIAGKVRLYPLTTDSEEIHERMSHGLLVYMTFWGTDSLEQNLEKCGFVEPKVAAMYVDGTRIDMPERNNGSAPNGENENNTETTIHTDGSDGSSRLYLSCIKLVVSTSSLLAFIY